MISLTLQILLIQQDTTDNTDNTDSTDSTDNTDNTDSTDSTDTPDTTTATTYNIAFSETNEVVATLSATEATAGTKINITIESVPDDYYITSITSDVSDLKIEAESETVYTFTMPESDVNLTINIEAIEYEAGAIYITNTGDVPSELQASSFYVKDMSNNYSTYTGETGIYIYFSSTVVNPGDTIYFGISDTNIDVSTYNLELTWYYHIANDENNVGNSFYYVQSSSNIINDGKGIEWCIYGYQGTTFITINRASKYNIAFSETNEVVATLSATEATAGTKIDITIVSVPDGYNITSITSDVSGLEIKAESDTLYTFNMPESDVNLTINIEAMETAADSYNVTITYAGDSATGPLPTIVHYPDDNSYSQTRSGNPIPYATTFTAYSGTTVQFSYILMTELGFSISSVEVIGVTSRNALVVSENITEYDSYNYYEYSFEMGYEDVNITVTLAYNVSNESSKVYLTNTGDVPSSYLQSSSFFLWYCYTTGTMVTCTSENDGYYYRSEVSNGVTLAVCIDDSIYSALSTSYSISISGRYFDDNGAEYSMSFTSSSWAPGTAFGWDTTITGNTSYIYINWTSR